MSRVLYYVIIISAGLILTYCSENKIVEPDIYESEISGRVKFLDESPGAFARVNLQDLSNNRTTADTADLEGMYKFDNLKGGDYILSFESTGYDINTFRVDITLQDNDTINQDIYIVYKMLDDEKARTINDSMVVVKYHRDGAGIGDNYDLIDNLTGYYGGDFFNNVTLSCEIYELPDEFNWTDTNIKLSADSVRENFVYVTEIEDVIKNGNHEAVFTGDDIPKILSNPVNGFVFVRTGEKFRILKIPCVDRLNNDFGLIINYK